jgi:hypothetical protein
MHESVVLGKMDIRKVSQRFLYTAFEIFARICGFYGNLYESITQHNTLCVLIKTSRAFAMKTMFLNAEFRRVGAL